MVTLFRAIKFCWLVVAFATLSSYAASLSQSNVLVPTLVVRGTSLESLQLQDTTNGISTKVVNATNQLYQVSIRQYNFQFAITNGPHGYKDIAIELVGAGAGTTIVQGVINTGPIVAGASTTPTAQIIIRHDLRQPFDATKLVWKITGLSVPGSFLAGQPGALARNVVTDYAAPRTEQDLITGIDLKTGSTFYKGQLSAVLGKQATVAQINAALDSLGARIVFSFLKTASLTLQVPDSGGIDGLLAISKKIMDSGAFLSAGPVYLPEASQLPPNITIAQALPGTNGLSVILSQVAARVDTAWGARYAGTSDFNKKTHVIVVDFFGKGNFLPCANLTPCAQLNSTITGLADGPTFSDPSLIEGHGYHVTGILNGKFGGLSDGIGQVTGSLPKTVSLHAIDLASPIISLTMPRKLYYICSSSFPCTWLEFTKENLRKIFAENPNGKFVLNFSLQYGCNPLCPLYSIAENDANDWREFARGITAFTGSSFNFERDAIQVSAAGNHNYTDASVASWFNASVSLNTGLTAQLPVLTNGLVVENRTIKNDVSPLTSRPTVGCLDVKSDINGNIGTIGDYVWSFTSPTTAAYADGTSMAAPQVAGIAAYMFMIRPDLPAAEIISKIKNTAQPYVMQACPNSPNAAPALDAYAALLSLDNKTFPLVRLALLQPDAVNPAAKFSLANAKQFLQAYFPDFYNGGKAGNLDLSRYDLNGDGITGGLATAPFPIMVGSDVTNKMSDFDILCEYAKSSLFAETDLAAFKQEVQRIYATGNHPEVASCATPGGVAIDPGNLSIGVNVITSLKATLTNTSNEIVNPQPNFIWSSSNENVVVTQSGSPSVMIRGVSLGKAVITATDPVSGTSGKMDLTVAQYPAPSSVECTKQGIDTDKTTGIQRSIWSVQFKGEVSGTIGDYISAYAGGAPLDPPSKSLSCGGWTMRYGLGSTPSTDPSTAICLRMTDNQPTTTWSISEVALFELTAVPHAIYFETHTYPANNSIRYEIPCANLPPP